MKYLDFTVKDFVLDDAFIQWVIEPDAQSDRFWQSWLRQHPEKAPVVAEARLCIQNLRFRQDALTAMEFSQVWQNIEQGRRQPARPVTLYQWPAAKAWRRMAAAITLLIAIGISVYFLQKSAAPIEITTDYGQTRKVRLPDGTLVTLNANSTLTYPQNWDSGQAREVWLEGEAFFEVTKKPNAHNVRFITHTKLLDVEVLGTQYNVKNRRGCTQVLLTEGKVALVHNARPADTSRVRLQPGDFAELTAGQQKIYKTSKMPAQYGFWRGNKYIFYKTPLAQIARLLEDNYGLKVQFKDAALARRELSGELPTGNVDVLLTGISESMNIKITRYRDTLILERRLAN